MVILHGAEKNGDLMMTESGFMGFIVFNQNFDWVFYGLNIGFSSKKVWIQWSVTMVVVSYKTGLTS